MSVSVLLSVEQLHFHKSEEMFSGVDSSVIFFKDFHFCQNLKLFISVLHKNI